MKLDILDLDLLYPLHFHEIKVFSLNFFIFSVENCQNIQQCVCERQCSGEGVTFLSSGPLWVVSPEAGQAPSWPTWTQTPEQELRDHRWSSIKSYISLYILITGISISIDKLKNFNCNPNLFPLSPLSGTVPDICWFFFVFCKENSQLVNHWWKVMM